VRDESASAVEWVRSNVALRVAVADVVPSDGSDEQRPVGVDDGDGQFCGATGDDLGVQPPVIEWPEMVFGDGDDFGEWRHGSGHGSCILR
jgi:hypothetical protein